MTSEKKPKAFFTLNLPRKPRDGDSIHVQAKLRKNPSEFSVILGVKTADDRNSTIEPTMAALNFKTVFLANSVSKVTTNWKTDMGWQEEVVIDSDWIDARGKVNLTLSFESNSILITDKGNSLITSFTLKFELIKINRLQIWGNVKELHEVSLKYNQKVRRRRLSRDKSNSS